MKEYATYDAAKSAYDAAKSAYDTAKSALDAAKSAYDVAKSTYDVADEAKHQAKLTLISVAKSEYYKAKEDEEKVRREYYKAKNDGADAEKLAEIRYRVEENHNKVSVAAKACDVALRS